jgi:MYXO-CTERM domain-containing protein
LSVTRTRNALVGSIVIALVRRSIRQRMGGRAPVWPYFVVGLVGVLALVVWRRRRTQPVLVPVLDER